MRLKFSALSAILRKESKAALREKHLKFVLLIGILLPMFNSFMQLQDTLRSSERAGGADSGNIMLSLATILMSWGFGLFFGAAFATTLALESFVGEKEHQTIEILLASPATDYDLFWSKVIAAGLISTCLGLCLGLINTFLIIIMSNIFGVTVNWQLLAQVMIYSFPIFLAVVVTFTSLGVIVSSRSATVKGAGQLFGVVFLALIFIPVIIIVLLAGKYAKEFKSVADFVTNTPIGVTVSIVFLILVLFNRLLLKIAIASFKREKILTNI